MTGSKCEVCGLVATAVADLQDRRDGTWHKAATCGGCREEIERAVANGHDLPSISVNVPLKIAVAGFNPLTPTRSTRHYSTVTTGGPVPLPRPARSRVQCGVIDYGPLTPLVP